MHQTQTPKAFYLTFQVQVWSWCVIVLDLDFEKQVAREDCYMYRIQEKVNTKPKTMIDVAKAKDNNKPTNIIIDIEK